MKRQFISVPVLSFILVLSACGGSESTSTLTFPSTALIDPNSASSVELLSIPGFDQALATDLIAARPYDTPGALHSVIGTRLDSATIERVYQTMFVQVGLNSGAEEDYKLIPSSMSARKLAHEFEEYRPYESIEQFKQEMSKYVSDAEVAYLARYVTLD